MEKRTIEFELPVTDKKDQHFTDLHIVATIETHDGKIQRIDINNIAYFPGRSSMGSNLVDFVFICAPELYKEIKMAALNNFKNTPA